MKIQILIFLFFMLPFFGFAQKDLPELPKSQNSKIIDRIAADKAINAEQATKLLAGYNQYPVLNKTGCNYKFYYQDTVLGAIPLRVYVPANYKNTQRSACVFQLHGAVSVSKFNLIDSLADADEGVLADPLKANKYIVIQPLADKSKGFTWGGIFRKGDGPYQFNLTYQRLANIVAALKQVLNIDDNRVYAFGHSDGADGAIGLGVYEPSQFAAVVAYNTMFKNLFAHDYYIRNIQNRSLYEVHSDRDALRRIDVNRQIIDSIKTFDNRISYKEYQGYEHWDKHLAIDAPNADKFMKANIRDAYQHTIFLETTQNSPYNSCDWLTVLKADTISQSTNWYKPFEVTYRYFLERQGEWYTDNYYQPLKSAVVKASYTNNVFTLQTSCAAEVALKISPKMVDLTKPIKVIINGKEVYHKAVAADKIYIVNNFKSNFDRDAIWVNQLNFKVE
ncbi:hypothetical protein INP83_20425 [Mucilaginibacter sp. 21P]|uniref:hypothetical protein n=1 Tax=Mucilaginibacter sp. 21P TaxID=2778902 RepID=UPI001C579BB6|nr:hypothetical protein [Mucilaginibacter sp. 21P]QXV65405.1 hypothetical protein INP83_20425 [Mucilaginibacter sp. 21P]